MLKLVLITVLAVSGISLGAHKPPVKFLGCGESHIDGVGWTVTDVNEDFSCDGSLIDPWVIMTSASCIAGHPAAKLEVRGPKWDPDTKTLVYSDKRRSVLNKIDHDNFNAQSGTSDMSLLVLTEKVVLSDYINTVCLPTPDMIFDKRQCFISKFVKDIYADGRRSPKILKHNELLVATPSNCLGAIGAISNEKNSHVMTRKLICAGSENITQGFEGDVGGPMICPVHGERGRYVQAGIVSSILSKHEEKKPALYTNLAPMWNWINDVMVAMKMDNSHYTYRPRIHDSNQELIIITPTYKRPGQMAFLTELAQTLMLVPNMHWLVVEDAGTPTAKVTDFLKKTGLKFEHLTGKTPPEYPYSQEVYRHVSNVNQALDYIRHHKTRGIFYVALEGVNHDIQIFEEIRKTEKVSMFPVAYGSAYGLSSPVLRNGIFDGYFEEYMVDRKYPVDFSGFAVNVEFLLKRPNAKMPYLAGYREDGFIKSLEPLGMNEVNFLADKCTKILVWKVLGPHVHELTDIHKYRGTNIEELAKQL